MNLVTLIGRFTADPTISATKTGKQLCKFTLAVKRPHSDETVDFIDMLAWENTGIFITNHFRKGQRVAVSGYLIVRKWEDKSGNKHKAYEVIVQDVYFADGAAKASNESLSVGDNKETAITEDNSEFQYQCTDDDLF